MSPEDNRQSTVVEGYSDERCAALMLNSAVDRSDYEHMRALVQRLGIDPDTVPHDRPD